MPSRGCGGPWRGRPGVPGAPGVLRLRHDRCGRRGPLAAIAELLPARRRRPRRPGRRAPSSRSRADRRASGSPTCGCSPAPSARGTGWPSGRDGTRKVTAIGVFDDGAVVPPPPSPRARSRRLWGLGDVRIGDAVGGAPAAAGAALRAADPGDGRGAPRRGDRGALHAALAQLAEQDPLIDVRQDDVRREIVGLAVRRGAEGGRRRPRWPTSTAWRSPSARRRRSASSGRSAPASAVELDRRGTNPFLATVGLRVEPARSAAVSTFRLEVELGSMPSAFFTAVEETVTATLRQGLHGWQVTGLRRDDDPLRLLAAAEPRARHVRQEHVEHRPATSGTSRRWCSSTALRARRAPTVLRADARASASRCRPTPSARVLPALARRGAVPLRTDVHGAAVGPHRRGPRGRGARAHPALPGLTHGEACWSPHWPATGRCAVPPLSDLVPVLTRGTGRRTSSPSYGGPAPPWGRAEAERRRNRAARRGSSPTRGLLHLALTVRCDDHGGHGSGGRQHRGSTVTRGGWRGRAQEGRAHHRRRPHQAGG